ncbi:thiaminase II/PqqC family protein [Klebsiella michiganensis]|uniref:Thiaminase-2/PQQC domain-containing protein n=1 Tax=Klebsiella michiganensis TaxID=1134687 RepID=A0A6P1UXK9_9ENTR|nr:iron-containing redox enzyme family protein [Klebsiella michiganensis]MEB8293103.1 iron-containing redox enzyme family protein [Klebsiella michiganensis]MXJ81333.1 hypothetical protein [Klebsiella michiganensis]QHS46668.1 hypothetical protein GW952_14205 [Klebsiella michiganensis]
MSYPYLKYDSALHEENFLITIVANDADITIETAEPRKLRDFLLGLDGATAINNLSAKHSIKIDDVQQLLETLRSEGVVTFEKEKSLTCAPQDFAGICRTIFPQWKKEVFTHDFWHHLTTGKLSRSSFAGWMLENFHFIEGATKRLSLVTAASSNNKRVRALFSQHFIEEYNHQLFFLKALQRLGFTKTQVLNHTPLPSTQAIINHMRECARRDVIAYASCSAFLESTGGDRKDGMVFYDALTKHYDKENKGIIKPLVDHAFLDEEYGHNDWLEKVCSCFSTLETDRANEALSSAQMLVETLKMWTYDMSIHYENVSMDTVLNPNRYR